MITIHHLSVSQSDRVVWLMEELGLPYKMVWHMRGPDGLMPPSYVALHPASTAPVVEDEGKMLVESAAILEYIAHKYGGGKLTVAPNTPHYFEYLYFLQFNNNVLGLFFVKMALAQATAGGGNAERVSSVFKRREDGYTNFLEQTLGKTPYLAGNDLTCADIMVMYDLVSLPGFRGNPALPNVQAYIARVEKRPAYIKAQELAGAQAKPPA
jgi:glutathione S-transferase